MKIKKPITYNHWRLLQTDPSMAYFIKRLYDSLFSSTGYQITY